MFERILILSASAGAGHVRAAEAIEKAVIQMQAAREVRHVDTLDYTNRVFRRLYSKVYLELVNGAPDVLGWLYDYLDQPWKNERRRLALDRLNTRPFVKLLEHYRPEMTICTHFLPAEIISWLKAKKRLTSRQAIVVTDLDIHAMWLCHHYEQYFVAMDETRVHMEKLGIPPEKITVSGIPIDPIFAENKDKQAMRRKHGLKTDRTTILVSAGGFGVGSIEHVIKSLLELRHPAQVVAISGRNDALRQRLTRLVSAQLQDRELMSISSDTRLKWMSIWLPQTSCLASRAA
jgi:processive 1,2-diacylglycerol beta-glucosyltransferase